MSLRQPHEDALVFAEDASAIRRTLVACSELLAWAHALPEPTLCAWRAEDSAEARRLSYIICVHQSHALLDQSRPDRISRRNWPRGLIPISLTHVSRQLSRPINKVKLTLSKCLFSSP